MGRAQTAIQKGFLSIYHYLADVLPYWVVSWDERYVRFVRENHLMKKISPAMVVATYFGDGYLWGLIGLFILIWGTPLDRTYVMIAFAITMINIALFRFLKLVFKRMRPGYATPLSEWGYRLLDTYSFPSGHATTSFGIAYALAHFYPILPVQVAAYAAASFIAVSRIHMAEHYPSDVISGALLGMLSSAFLLPIFERILRL